MNRITSLLQNLRQTFSVVALTIVFLVSVAFAPSLNQFQAFAGPLTPEGTSYEINKSSSPEKPNIENAQRANTDTKNFGDNIREKLNLDQPVPESTKEFFGSIKDKAEEIIDTPQRVLENAGDKGSAERNK